MNHTTLDPTAVIQLATAFENLTLGMLFGDVNFTQFVNLSMDNLTEHIHEHLQRTADNGSYMGSGSGGNSGGSPKRDPLTVVISVTICYAIIFIAGLLGNVITCTVISRNKSMHTATNYYLFNLAISDLLLLISGMPHDTYNIWFPASYPLNQSFCIFQGLLSETSTNATVLTITSFTVERYIAICHPFRQHTMSKLSRAIKFILAIWIVAFCLAIPQAIQFGVVTIYGGRSCTVKNVLVEHAFEVSSFLFFVGPMTLICVLYVLIGFKLRKSKLMHGAKRRGTEFGRVTGQTRVIRMLVAVAVAFFLCWAPFHAQRIMAVYGKATRTTNDLFHEIYTVLTYVSGVLYFLSTSINPLLYSIMSHKFRDAFKSTLARHFGIGTECKKNHTYSALSKCNGNGSIRLTATLVTNRANNNTDAHKSETLESEAVQHQRHQEDVMNCLKNKCPSHHHKYRHRCVSVSSQATLLTTVSKNDTVTLAASHAQLDQLHANANGKHHSTLGTIAEKLRRGTRKVLQFTTTTTTAATATATATTTPSNNTSPTHGNAVADNIVVANGKDAKLHKDASVDSAHTNTISNSSLQEMDAEEFDSAELAKYMGEINSEIVSSAK